MAITIIHPKQLGTGTRDSTKFLRDDGTWQNPPAGGTPPDMSMNKLAPAANTTITAGYSAYVSDDFEIVDTFDLEIGDLATFEIG